MFKVTVEQTMQNIKPYVSVVIPTYNRSSILALCLDSLFNQTYPKDRYEIIIVNDGSKDNTEDVLREFEKKAPCGFIWISQKNQGITTAENTGLSRTKGTIVCFTADDCIIDKNWISNLVNGFSNDKIGAIGGKVVSYQTNTLIQQFIEEAQILDQEKFFKRNTLITGSAAYRKQVLTDIHGFDNFLIACEDLDLSIKTQLLGYSLRYIPDAVVYHDHPATVKGLFFQQYRNGKGYVQLHRKYGRTYNLFYVTGVYGYQILKKLLYFPFNLVYIVILKKKKYFTFKPLFLIVCESAMILGIIRETICGKEYKGELIRSRIDFFTFMDRITISFLWQRLKRKFLDNNNNMQ